MDQRQHFDRREKREHPETRILKLEHNLEKQQIAFNNDKELTKVRTEFEKQLDAKEREIERLKGEVADLEEELEEVEDSIEKQSGELGGIASVFKGIDLPELGANIIRKLANPKLLTSLGMTTEEEIKDNKVEDTSSFASVKEEVSPEKKEQIEAANQIASFLKEMPLSEFKKVYHILAKLEAERTLIDKVYTSLGKEDN